MNKEDTIRRAFKAVTGFDDYNKFNIKLILGDEDNNIPTDFEKNTLYGFNVRLQTKDPVTPILGGKQNDKTLQGKSVQDLFNTIKPELTILKVFEDCSDREIEFSYTGDKDVKSGKVNLTLKDKKETSSIIEKLQQEGSFLDIHKKEMFPDSSDMFYWISRENEGKLDRNFLSNILVISSNEDNIAFVKQHKIHFLRFLLKLQAAYSLILSEKVETTAVRASIAQVMARNMSHNLGSHVFSHLIKTEVYDYLTDEHIKESLTNYLSFEGDKVFEHEDSKDPNSPLKNQQLGYFNQYLKSRMDYLSEVTFGIPTMLTSKMIYNDVFKELDRVRLLLNYISGISNFQYEFDFQHGKNSIMNDKEPDFAAAFPSDVLGCQAFYNIIENIIRNTAKHAKRTKVEKVTFTIKFKDIDTSASAELREIEGIDDLYCVEIDNGINEDEIDELVRKQKSRINESVLDEYNQLRGHSLGLLEMEASAAFLRQIDMPDIESDDYYVDDDESFYHERNGVKRLNILKPFKTTGGALGYRFFVQKPKEFLFVGEWDVNEPQKKELRNFGIEFISDEDFCAAIEAGKTLPHQFLLYNNSISEEANQFLQRNNDCKTLLPLRKLEVDSNEVCKCWSNNQTDKQNNTTEIDGSDVLQNLKNYAWKLYFQSVIKDELKEKENTDILIRKAFVPQSADKNQVIFLHHGDNESYERSWSVLNSTGEAGQSIYTKQPEFKAEGWLEDLSSRTMEMLPSFRELSKIGGRKEPMSNYCLNLKGEVQAAIDTDRAAALRMNIFEAYHNKVIVIDERVQRFALSNVNETNDPKGKIPVNKIFESTNVLIPETKLDPTSFDGNAINELDSFVMENLENAFVLVHYGVLERMYEKTDDITDKLNDWSEKAKRVVVTSGRGSHSLPLPDSVCFANLSSVLNVFVENRNKYSINYLIHQSRRKNG